MLTCVFLLFFLLLFIGDIAILLKGIDEWKKKIETNQGLKKNIWMVLFYIITTLLIILMISVYWGSLLK
jgi:hypothetical protein